MPDSATTIDKHKKRIQLDPRIRFIFFVVFSIITFTESDPFIFKFNCLLIMSLFFFSRKYNKGIKVVLLFSALWIFEYLLAILPQSGLLLAFELVFFILQKMAAVFSIGYWVFVSMKTGAFLSAMQSMKLPKGFIITCAVIFRYAPSVFYEFWYIKSTMKLRGIEASFKNIVTHPIKTIEYSMVPLILRSMTIADRLSASAMTRGLDLETERSSYYAVKLRIYDYLIALAICTLSIGSSLLRKYLTGDGL